MEEEAESLRSGGNDPEEKHRVKVDNSLYVSPLDHNIWVFFGGLIAIMAASIFTRFYKIAQPPHIA